MKKLKSFMKFLAKEFFEGKVLLCNGVSEWRDYNTQKILGSVAELVIIEDNTDYHIEEGQPEVDNTFEKIKVKVPVALNIPKGSTVQLINPVGTVYGDYSEKLSVTADNLRIVKQ